MKEAVDGGKAKETKGKVLVYHKPKMPKKTTVVSGKRIYRKKG